MCDRVSVDRGRAVVQMTCGPTNTGWRLPTARRPNSGKESRELWCQNYQAGGKAGGKAALRAPGGLA